MGKSKNELVTGIIEYIKKMEPLMKEAKLKDNYLSIPEEVSKVPMPLVREAFKWVKEIFESTFKESKKIKNLCPDSVWANYKAMGDCEDLREMKMLKETLKILRKSIVVRNKPVFFVRSKINGIIKRNIKTKNRTKTNKRSNNKA